MVEGPERLAAYRAYGLIVASELSLSELPPGGDLHDASMTVSACATLPEAAEPGHLGGEGRAIDRTEEGVFVRFPGAASFLISADGRDIQVGTPSRVLSSTVTHLLIDHVLPSCLSERGELVLHASGVVLHGGVVLFVGPSGAGKSTLAAAFARRGEIVMCDDGARLVSHASTLSVAPSYPGLRLWPDGVDAIVGPAEGMTEVTLDSSKRRWVPASGPVDPLPLACVCLLDDGQGAPRAHLAPRRDALVHLLDNSYRLPGSAPIQVRAQLDRATELVRTVPVFRLSYVDDFDGLGRVADLVESLLMSGPGTTTSRSA